MKVLNRDTLISFALISSSFASTVMASGTATVNVNATVNGACAFTTPNATVNLPSLDPSTSNQADVTASASLSFWCSQNTSYTITQNSGNNSSTVGSPNMSDGASHLLPYTLGLLTPGMPIAGTQATGSGAGKNSPIALAVTGTVKYADYSVAVPGTYTDTVTLTITP